MTEETQAQDTEEFDPNDLTGLDLTFDAKTWEEGGMEPAGAVGYKIESAKIEKRKTKKGEPFAICSVEVRIHSRPGQKIEKPAPFWDDFSLNPRYIDTFKRFAAAAGIKPAPGAPVNIPEMVKALPGKSGFGVIVHKEFVHNGENRKKAQFSRKFGKSFAEVT